jgi:hypothetical protein
MDITSVSGASAYQQLNVANNVSTAVAAKVLDSQRTQGAAALQLLQSSTVQASANSSANGVDVKG